MTIIDKTVVSEFAPDVTNVRWIDTSVAGKNVAKIFLNGAWVPESVSLSIPDGAFVDVEIVYDDESVEISEGDAEKIKTAAGINVLKGDYAGFYPRTFADENETDFWTEADGEYRHGDIYAIFGVANYHPDALAEADGYTLLALGRYTGGGYSIKVFNK